MVLSPSLGARYYKNGQSRLVPCIEPSIDEHVEKLTPKEQDALGKLYFLDRILASCPTPEDTPKQEEVQTGFKRPVRRKKD